ncbi:MAG TPA: ABC transporter permease subunit [Firmicutes bacterium]|nr:ABC transporter permease subunit [Bacillota bacterium]
MSIMSRRWHATKLISTREWKDTWVKPGIYVVMVLSLLLGAFALRSTLTTVANMKGGVLTSPLTFALFLAVSLGGTYIALCSAMAIARERETGTLEVLFYGPVDSISYIFGRFLEQVFTFVTMLVFLTIYFLFAGIYTNVGFSTNFLLMLVFSVFVVGGMVAFGIFISSLMGRTRSSIIVFLALVIFFLGMSFGYRVLVNIPSDELSVAQTYLRIIFQVINSVLSWISPFAYLQRGFDAAALREMGNYFITIGQTLVYTVVCLALAIFCFKKRGVKR